MAKKKKKSEPIVSVDDPRFRSFLMSALRRASRFWKPARECLIASRIDRGMYKCQNLLCGNVVGAKEIKIDHIDPVIPVTGFQTWDEVIRRLFCDADKYQAICATCHTEKTNMENEERKRLRKEKAVLNYSKNRRRKSSD